MSFIHPDASLINGGRAASAAVATKPNNKQFSQLEAQPPPLEEAHASSPPRDRVEIKIVMLKVQVIRSIQFEIILSFGNNLIRATHLT
ncbi:hypothetical protein AWZ03_006937 [Drosophila navojoa]|uniref:Uncharacterized protein n=1 Tax=Drosophila navojoa TaxID=7232 RepID=A0A484BFR5_DRONA|nr:hypothetical protein AWZ03_006937 [Drosophila navojoa]